MIFVILLCRSKKDGPNLIVKRSIKADSNTSKWEINGRSSNEGTVSTPIGFTQNVKANEKI